MGDEFFDEGVGEDFVFYAVDEDVSAGVDGEGGCVELGGVDGEFEVGLMCAAGDVLNDGEGFFGG